MGTFQTLPYIKAEQTKQKKLYISTITVEGLPVSAIKAIRNTIEITIFENFKDYRIITDDDIKIMYKKAEALMASGCNAESCQQQIADAIDADEIIYGEVIKKGNEISFKGKRLSRDKSSLQIVPTSIVQQTFPEQFLEYYIVEIAKKLINPQYTIVTKKITKDDVISTIQVETFKEVPLQPIQFTTTDDTLSSMVQVINDLIQKGDSYYEKKQYEQAISQYDDIIKKIANKLTIEKQQKLNNITNEITKRRDASYCSLYKIKIEALDSEYRQHIEKYLYNCDTIVKEYKTLMLEIKSIDDNRWLDGKSDIVTIINKRLMKIYEASADAYYKQYDFVNAFKNIKQAFLCVDDLNKKEKEQLNVYYGKKLEAIQVTGENYIANKIYALTDRAQYFNLLDDLTQAKKYCNDAYSLLKAHKQFISKQMVEHYNDVALVVGGTQINKNDIQFDCVLGLYVDTRKEGKVSKVVAIGLASDVINFYIDNGTSIISINGQDVTIVKDAKVKVDTISDYTEVVLQLENDGNKYFSIIEKKQKGIYQENCYTWLLEPQFDDAENFSDGMAAVKKDGKWGYINKQGTIVIPPQFDDAKNFSDGMARVKKDDEWGYINKQGKFVIPPQFVWAEDFSDGMAAVEKEGKWGYINKQGKFVIPLQFDLAGDFSDGMAGVKKDGKGGYINKQGEFVIPPQFDEIWSFSDGMAVVRKDGKCGYINKQGTIVIPLQFDDAGDFSDGMAVVKKDGKCGYINKQGKFVIPPQFDDSWRFSDGMAAVEKDGKWGYIKKAELI
jgi:hypothetical protein